MKPAVDVITTLSRVKGENGADQFVGSINLSKLKKAKSAEMDIVLVPVDSVPKALVGLLKKANISTANLLMFAAVAQQEGPETQSVEKMKKAAE